HNELSGFHYSVDGGQDLFRHNRLTLTKIDGRWAAQ
ncbi:MAG: hypothetical protein ACI9HY_000989, partial [Planctomycetaceae bacterium]